MLSLILPTFNEAKNLERLLPLLDEVLAGLQHEIIVVDDDSPDGTWQVAEGIAKRQRTVRVVRRLSERGLSSAVTEGFSHATGEVLAVMDSDGQHDPRLLPDLYRAIQGGAHVAIATRYAPGASTRRWRGYRLILSRIATFFTARIPRVVVSDPMSGYFAVRRTIYHSIETKVKPRGFKILLEILAHLPRGTVVSEVPLQFGARWAGRSKLSLAVQGQFLLQISRILGLRFRVFLWEAQWVLLFILFIVVGGALLPAAWNVRLLALQPSIRAAATAALRSVADQEGWLLSDIAVTSVSPSSMRILHQEHRRSVPAAECIIVRFEPLTLIPCP